MYAYIKFKIDDGIVTTASEQKEKLKILGYSNILIGIGRINHKI